MTSVCDQSLMVSSMPPKLTPCEIIHSSICCCCSISLSSRCLSAASSGGSTTVPVIGGRTDVVVVVVTGNIGLKVEAVAVAAGGFDVEAVPEADRAEDIRSAGLGRSYWPAAAPSCWLTWMI